MKAALYIIGEPGVGKSELVDELTRGLQAEDLAEPFAMRAYYGLAPQPVIELGHRRGGKSGTDSLSSAVIEKVIPWLDEAQPELLLGEGDKLAVDRFMLALKERDYRLRIVLLHGPGAAARRRLQRGSHQNETWVIGRRSKALALAQRWTAATQVLDARLSPEELAGLIDSDVATVLRTAHRVEVGDGVQ